MKIYITQGSSSQPLEPEEWKNEKDMQLYIQNNPSCVVEELIENNPEDYYNMISLLPRHIQTIAAYQNKTEIVLIGREFPTSAGIIDFLLADRKGGLYIVESKLARNPEQRHVHSQLYDYAQAIWHSYRHYEDFENFKEKCDSSLQKYFDKNFNEHIKKEFSFDDDEFDAWLENLKDNISKNISIFLILAMDRIEDDARKDQIFYHNNISKGGVKMFGVELLRYFTNDGKQIIVPKSYGREAIESSAESRSGKRGEILDEDAFFEKASEYNLAQEEIAALHKLYDFSKQNLEVRGGWGSFKAYFNKMSASRSLYHVWPTGNIVFNTPKLAASSETSRYANEFKEKLEKIGIKVGDDYQKTTLKLSIRDWSPKSDQFINVIRELTNS